MSTFRQRTTVRPGAQRPPATAARLIFREGWIELMAQLGGSAGE